MRNRRKAVFEEPGYWQSYSDMMAALLLIFVLFFIWKSKDDAKK